jgi:hypothetical protein
VTCDFDSSNLVTGSRLCTLCGAGYVWNEFTKSCGVCPNGVV